MTTTAFDIDDPYTHSTLCVCALCDSEGINRAGQRYAR